MKYECQEEIARLRAALEWFVKYGAMVDTNPTLGGRLGDGTNYFLWSEYLKSADRNVRDHAKRALDGGVDA
jgi:hypothetical protein